MTKSATSNGTIYESVGTVTVTIANNGPVAGAEVVQLYVSLPTTAGVETPVRQLRGFEKISLAAGESGTVELVLRRKDLSYWSVEKQQWILPTGDFVVSVAASSRDVRLEGTLTI